MKKIANATDYLNMETKELFKIYSKDKNKEISFNSSLIFDVAR